MFDSIKSIVIIPYGFLQNKARTYRRWSFEWMVFYSIFYFYQMLLFAGLLIIVLFISNLSTNYFLSTSLWPFDGNWNRQFFHNTGEKIAIFEIIGAIASVGSFIGIYLAYLEYRQNAIAQRYEFRPLSIPKPVSQLLFDSKEFNDRNSILLYKLERSRDWSMWIDDIIDCNDHDKPVFSIQNEGKGPASQIRVAVCKGYLENEEHRYFDFSKKGVTVNSKTLFDLVPTKFISFYPVKEAKEKEMFKDKFCLRISYYSEYTDETITDYYVALVKEYDAEELERNSIFNDKIDKKKELDKLESINLTEKSQDENKKIADKIKKLKDETAEISEICNKYKDSEQNRKYPNKKYPDLKFKNKEYSFYCNKDLKEDEQVELEHCWSKDIKKIIIIDRFIKKNSKTRIIKGLVKNQFTDVIADVVEDVKN
jgi:hypothetical protein